MSKERKLKEDEVKRKISDILFSVKEEKQHIENQLASNDKKINQYCQQYEQLRYQNDFSELSNNEKRILSSLVESLAQSQIDPVSVLGKEAKELVGENTQSQLQLDREQLIKVQQKIIYNLMEEIKKVQQA